MEAKIFIGSDEDLLQHKLDKFFEDNRLITVQKVVQSSSTVYHSFQTTITIFYTNNV